ncbi:hypothetical protein PHISCL_05039 [Aspergillus sclerotialis]|uniref:Xylanolytic transcriptional activator regulatory domain-containing protein n=1 Tax=Aspergillus sclerotialis TaxID=2070753 RepID=A0A3A2ZHU8_9EURO|nr:hypothetical protein PHISCL_05039 [Aspergillus sclerotialis]
MQLIRSLTKDSVINVDRANYVRTGTTEPAVTANVQAGDTPGYEEKAVLPEQSIVELSTHFFSRDYPAYDTSALPGGKEMAGPVSPSVGPWQDVIGQPLPPREVLDSLIGQFFNSVNWFMMVFHEEHFRRRYESLIVSTQGEPANNNFLWLVMLVLGIGAYYSSLGARSGHEESSLRQFSEDLFVQVEHRFCRIIGSPNIEAVQICILLGSFRLFNGRPTAGLGILGSGVKVAQVIGLHRESMWKGISDVNRELRRRTWWALEIFDKYAAIAFGRPCTIDESNCSIAPPVDLRLAGQLDSDQSALLEYHKRKFELYRLMGPFLGRRNQADRLETVRNLHDQLRDWERRLPSSLRLQSFKDDVPSERPPLRQLQALALQLTYDNLQIILHRSVAFGDSCDTMHYSDAPAHMQGSSFHREQLLQAALRTSELGHYNHLLQACRKTHAAMHVGICLFTAGVVLCAICLSQPLSIISQRAKTGIMAILRLHRDSFSAQHILSAQSVRILEDSVAAVMQFEQHFILGNPRPRLVNTQPGSSSKGDVVGSTNQNSFQVADNSQPAESEAFLAPLQEVFAHHLQDGALGSQPANSTVTDQTPTTIDGSYEEMPMLGPPNFSWNGDLYSMTDPGFADANQLWLWSDSPLSDLF